MYSHLRLIVAGGLLASIPAQAQTYTSPFAISLDSNISSWTSDFSARNAAVVANASPLPADWYTTDYNTSHPYGPDLPQLYSSASTPNPAIVNELTFDRGPAVFNSGINSVPTGVNPVTWEQQRLMAAASSLIGTHYQHLHMPQFDPASVTGSTFPWSPVSTNALLQTTQDLDAGRAGTVANPYEATYGSAQAGIDCTDFAAYIYNLALGIQMHSGTANQITFTSGSGPAVGNLAVSTVLSDTGATITPNFLYSPNYGTGNRNGAGSLDAIIAQLQPGDLLYMQGDDTILHVVVWLGEYGTNADGSPSTVPLVISSHDNTPAIFDTTDIDPTTGLPLEGTAASHLPPPGVEILPFTSDTWFYQNFSVGMQVLVVPEPSVCWLLVPGLALLAFASYRRRRI